MHDLNVLGVVLDRARVKEGATHRGAMQMHWAAPARRERSETRKIPYIWRGGGESQTTVHQGSSSEAARSKNGRDGIPAPNGWVVSQHEDNSGAPAPNGRVTPQDENIPAPNGRVTSQHDDNSGAPAPNGWMTPRVKYTPKGRNCACPQWTIEKNKAQRGSPPMGKRHQMTPARRGKKPAPGPKWRGVM